MINKTSLLRATSVSTLIFITATNAEPTLPDPLAAGWQGKPVCEKLHEDAQQRILKCSFAPGVGHEKHYHVPHFGYALSGGKMRLEDAKGVREAELATGSNYLSNGTEWHQVLNIGSTTVTYLIIESKQHDTSKNRKQAANLTTNNE